jgi:hypothetical protein
VNIASVWKKERRAFVKYDVFYIFSHSVFLALVFVHLPVATTYTSTGLENQQSPQCRLGQKVFLDARLHSRVPLSFFEECCCCPVLRACEERRTIDRKNAFYTAFDGAHVLQCPLVAETSRSSYPCHSNRGCSHIMMLGHFWESSSIMTCMLNFWRSIVASVQSMV